jgi:hypothetical protein
MTYTMKSFPSGGTIRVTYGLTLEFPTPDMAWSRDEHAKALLLWDQVKRVVNGQLREDRERFMTDLTERLWARTTAEPETTEADPPSAQPGDAEAFRAAQARLIEQQGQKRFGPDGQRYWIKEDVEP